MSKNIKKTLIISAVLFISISYTGGIVFAEGKDGQPVPGTNTEVSETQKDLNPNSSPQDTGSAENGTSTVQPSQNGTSNTQQNSSDNGKSSTGGSTNSKIILSSIDYSNAAIVLVNKNILVSSSLIPEKLRMVKARCAPGIKKEQKLMNDTAAKALEEMFSAADKNKIKLYCVSGYRSYETQKRIYSNKVKGSTKNVVERYTAYPGSSEHQTGLAMDVTNKSGLNKSLLPSFGDTKEGKWLKNNAWKYGFIIRYPYGKEKITGYNYEPWHVRYVGKQAAAEITSKNITLEEYVESVNNIKAAFNK